MQNNYVTMFTNFLQTSPLLCVFSHFQVSKLYGGKRTLTKFYGDGANTGPNFFGHIKNMGVQSLFLRENFEVKKVVRSNVGFVFQHFEKR